MQTFQLLKKISSATSLKRAFLTNAQPIIMARSNFHSSTLAGVRAFPEVETEKKITHTPTSVSEREQIRKMEKTAHSDLDEIRPPSSK